MIMPMEAPKKARKFLGTDRSRRGGSSLSIDTVLEKSRETSIVKARENALERLGFTEWKIWKLLHIEWG
jgi:hypothetical protein